MKQVVNNMIEALWLDVGINGKATSAETKPFVTDEDVAHADFSYSILLDMLLYFSGKSQSDIACATVSPSALLSKTLP